MNRLVLDAGALIAIDRNDRDMLSRVRRAWCSGEPAVTNPMAIAQVWRDGKRQATLAKALRDVEVRTITADDGRRAGELLGAAGRKDAVDATVALLAESGDQLYTSDPGDLRTLCQTAGIKAMVIGC
jgi:hypothetical protein